VAEPLDAGAAGAEVGAEVGAVVTAASVMLSELACSATVTSTPLTVTLKLPDVIAWLTLAVAAVALAASTAPAKTTVATIDPELRSTRSMSAATSSVVAMMLVSTLSAVAVLSAAERLAKSPGIVRVIVCLAIVCLVTSPVGIEMVPLPVGPPVPLATGLPSPVVPAVPLAGTGPGAGAGAAEPVPEERSDEPEPEPDEPDEPDEWPAAAAKAMRQEATMSLENMVDLGWVKCV